MKSVIDDLFNPESGFLDKTVNSEEYGKLQYEVEDLYDSLLKTLTEEQKLSLEKLYNKMLAKEGEGSSFHYKEGFKLGLALAVEAIQ